MVTAGSAQGTDFICAYCAAGGFGIGVGSLGGSRHLGELAAIYTTVKLVLFSTADLIPADFSLKLAYIFNTYIRSLGCSYGSKTSDFSLDSARSCSDISADTEGVAFTCGKLFYRKSV